MFWQAVCILVEIVGLFAEPRVPIDSVSLIRLQGVVSLEHQKKNLELQSLFALSIKNF